jgi:dihydrolipoamide dehydrogenase
VPCFPTISEVWLRLLEAHRDAQPISTEKVTA